MISASYNADMSNIKWVVLFSNFTIKTLNTGLRKAFGVLLIPLQEQFHEDVWLIGLIASASVSIGDFIGPVVGGLSKRIGCRIVVMLGGILFTSGLILAALATTIIPLTFFLCIIVGLGYGLTNDIPLAALGWYFPQHFNQANSFAGTGGCLGFILIGPLTALFLDLYGWRGTMLLLGAISFHVTACGAVLKDPKEPVVPLIQTTKKSYETISDTDNKHESGIVKCFNYIIQSLDVQLFREPMFFKVTLITSIQRFIQIAWTIYLVPNVISKGVSNLSASFISTSAGIGTGVGHLMPGVTDSLTEKCISSKTLWTIAISMTSVSLVLDAVVESYAGMLILGAWQGIGIGMMYCTNSVVLYEEFGQDRMMNSLGWVRGISGFGRVLGGILPGWIYQTTNCYRCSFVILGVIQAIAILVLYLGRIPLRSPCTDSDRKDISNNKH